MVSSGEEKKNTFIFLGIKFFLLRGEEEFVSYAVEVEAQKMLVFQRKKCCTKVQLESFIF